MVDWNQPLQVTQSTKPKTTAEASSTRATSVVALRFLRATQTASSATQKSAACRRSSTAAPSRTLPRMRDLRLCRHHLRQSELDLDGDQVLLRAVVEVALEASALMVLGGHKPLPGGAQLFEATL
jgi:ribosomal protein S14